MSRREYGEAALNLGSTSSRRRTATTNCEPGEGACRPAQLRPGCRSSGPGGSSGILEPGGATISNSIALIHPARHRYSLVQFCTWSVPRRTTCELHWRAPSARLPVGSFRVPACTGCVVCVCACCVCASVPVCRCRPCRLCAYCVCLCPRHAPVHVQTQTHTQHSDLSLSCRQVHSHAGLLRPRVLSRQPGR